MHVHVLPKEITYRLPHRESDRIPSFVRTYVQYTQRDSTCQNTLTNSTIGKCHHSSKEPCDLYHWHEWKAPQSAGIALVNAYR